MKKFSKFTSREYSLIQVEAYYEMLDQIGKELGDTTHPLFIYDARKKLLDIYFQMDKLNELFGVMGSKMNDSDYFDAKISEFEESLSEIQEFLEGKEVGSFAELQGLYKLFTKFFKGIAYVWVVPRLENVSPEFRERAMKTRERTEAYSGLRDKLFPEILKKFFPDLSEYTYFLPVSVLYSGKVDSETADKAKKYSNGYVFYDRKVVPISEKESFLKSYDIEIESDIIDEGIKEIKGQIANKGKVTGVCKIVYTDVDLDKVSGDRDVIVAPMTRPEFIPAMKKAVAFVTDEGGVTCHAAIVSREMGKPCIIGTKNATDILKDGMEVEVDADNGIIRILG